MTNEEIYLEMTAIGKRMDKLFNEKRLDERNELVSKWRELYLSYNFGFSAVEEIETITWGRNWTRARIIKHYKDENRFLIRNDKGWEVIVSGLLLRKVREQTEQLE